MVLLENHVALVEVWVIVLNLVLVKLLELHHLGYDLRHYHARHHAFIKQFNLPAHFQFDAAAG